MFTNARTAALLLLAIPLVDAELCGNNPAEDALVSEVLTALYRDYLDGSRLDGVNLRGALALLGHETLATAWRRVKFTRALAAEADAAGAWDRIIVALDGALRITESA